MAHKRIKKENQQLENKKVLVDTIYSKLIIEPDNNYKKLWDIKLFFLIILVSTYFMYLDIFDQQQTKEQWYLYFQYYVTIAFLLDIILQFFVAYRNKFNHIVRSPSKIVKNYLRGLFFLDLMASIPFEFINVIVTVQNDSYFQIMKIPKMFKILKNLKLFKLT